MKRKKYQRKNNYFAKKRSSFVDNLRPYPERLLDVEDRRRFHPHKHWIAAKTLQGTPAEVSATIRNRSGSRKVSLSRSRLEFVDPRNTVVCKRRTNRRKALFMLKKIGRGKKGSGKRRKMTEYSKVRC